MTLIRGDARSLVRFWEPAKVLGVELVGSTAAAFGG